MFLYSDNFFQSALSYTPMCHDDKECRAKMSASVKYYQFNGE